MMKKISLWLMALIFALTATATAQSKYEELELKGNVKSILQSKKLADGKLMEPLKIYHFTPKRKMFATNVYYALDNFHIHSFDDAERPLAIFHNDLTHLSAEYKYDLKNKNFSVYRDSQLAMYGELDDKGRIITAYGRVGNDKSALQMDNSKQSKQLSIQKFDDRGNEIFSDMRIVIEGTSKSITTIESTYNDKNQLTFEIRTRVDRENLIHHRKYLYNDKGFQTEIQGTDIIDGKSTDRGSFIHTHHKIDEQGNWLERSTKLNGVEVYRETRLFEYY